MWVRRLFVAISVVVVLGTMSCQQKSPDVSSVKVDFKLVPFFKELHAIKPDSLCEAIPALKQKYGHFLEGYSVRVIKVGPTNDSSYCEYLKSFLEYDANKDVFEKCKVQYADIQLLSDEILDAYQHYLHYFPKATVPDVYLQISGFNQSMVVDSGLVGVSVEKYLGADCQFYEWLTIPNYLRRKMVPEKIVPDLMKAIAFTEFTYNDSVDDVVNNMIYQGKILYFAKAMIPTLEDSLLFDFSEKELEWCADNESEMWGTMVEKRYLFNSNGMDIQKFVGDAPFSAHFGQESPGRAATWIGYQIVSSYIEMNPTVDLPQLMAISDGHIILAGSGYRP